VVPTDRDIGAAGLYDLRAGRPAYPIDDLIGKVVADKPADIVFSEDIG